MAISKEDIKPGWYWAKFRDFPTLTNLGMGTMGLKEFELVLVTEEKNAAGTPVTYIWYHGHEVDESFEKASELYDFIARAEPPEGV
jgi:hypothetical protein